MPTIICQHCGKEFEGIKSRKYCSPRCRGKASRKLTPAVIKKLKEAFKLGASDPEAASYAGVAVATLRKHKLRYPKEAERFKALKLGPNLQARKAVIESFELNPALAFKYLERKARDEFAPESPRFKASMSDRKGNKIVFEVVNMLENKDNDELDETQPDLIDVTPEQISYDENSTKD